MTKYKIGKEEIPASFAVKILLRTFKESEMKSIWESYKGAKLKAGPLQPPTPQQTKIAALRKEGMSNKAISQQMKLTISRVVSAVTKVAVYEYINS